MNCTVKVAQPESILPLSVDDLLAGNWTGVTRPGDECFAAALIRCVDRALGLFQCKVIGFTSCSELRQAVPAAQVPAHMEMLLETGFGLSSSQLRWRRDLNSKASAAPHVPIAGEIVYFLRAGGFIKIGKTTGHPDARVAELRTGCPFPIEVIGFIPGGLEDERALHRRFQAIRAHGEWFHATTELLAYIAEAIA